MIEEFWAEFVEATGIDGTYEAWAFAEEMPELATALALLVRDGPKRATAGPLAEFEGSDDIAFPEVGDLNLILDGSGRTGLRDQNDPGRDSPIRGRRRGLRLGRG